MATHTAETWQVVLQELEAWSRLRHQPDCPVGVQRQLDSLLGYASLIRAAPDLLAACKMMASPGCSGCRGRVPWVHNAALTSDIEPLRKICLAFANVWNNYMWPAIAKAEGQAENAP